MKRLLIFLFSYCLILPSWADVTLPGWMTSNMVLQQKTKVHLQATAKKGATVKITTSWDGKTVKAIADKATGAFEFDLDVPSAGGPYTLTFDDGKKLVLDNVMSGEVWFCSGQSNMEMPVKGWGQVMNYEQEVANANHPLIRLFQVKKVVAHTPQTVVPLGHTNGWAVCSPEMVEEFSAAAYFFAREVSEKLGIAVGVVNSSWGGTPAESWPSLEALQGVMGFQSHAKRLFETGFDEQKIEQLYQAERAEWMQEVFAPDQGLENGNIDKATWASDDFNDSDWSKSSQPLAWSKIDELKEFDGIVWMRKVVEVPAALAGKDLKLNLGGIDDEDITYWNGQRIGMTSGWNKNRTYTVPGKFVKAGKNTLTVRVYDLSGEGGLYKEAKDFYLASGNTKISLAGDWSWKKSIEAVEIKNSKGMTEPVAPNSSWYPAGLYNSMVAPFLSMPIRGFLWYQGCSNVGRAVQYESLFQALILDWQARFNKNSEVAPYPKPQPEGPRRFFQYNSMAIPFYFVQIANYMQRKDLQPQSGWAAIREAQRKALRLDGVGMAVNIDIGMANDIHPKNKQEVGRRLALLALNRTYGKEEFRCAAPEFRQMNVVDGKALLLFMPTQGGDMLEENSDIKGFSIAGPDHVWHVAKASYTQNENSLRFGWPVVVECPEVPHPVAVRYGWADNPECNLMTVSGLPVGPFRTDDWDDIR